VTMLLSVYVSALGQNTAPPPKPVEGDPPDGIPVTGGTVHRGTGTLEMGPDDERKAVVCWVDVDATAPCTDFRWYQWVCTTISSIDYHDGKGPTANPPVPKGVSILSKTGAYLRVNEWSPDDQATLRNKYRKPMFTGQNTPCGEPKEPLKAGPYVGPPDIPGKPAPKDKKEELWRFVDAPEGALAADPIMKKAFHKGKGPVNRREQPPPGNPITLELK
jgi:hypothetical protein